MSCDECHSGIIDKQSLSCFPESPTFVTYRARLTGTSETNSTILISLLEEWVSGGASVIVTGLLMRADTECPVAITSLSEEECSSSPPSCSTSSNNNYSAVIGGVTAAVIILITVTTLTFTIIIVAWRNRCGRYTMKFPK